MINFVGGGLIQEFVPGSVEYRTIHSGIIEESDEVKKESGAIEIQGVVFVSKRGNQFLLCLMTEPGFGRTGLQEQFLDLMLTQKQVEQLVANAQFHLAKD